MASTPTDLLTGQSAGSTRCHRCLREGPTSGPRPTAVAALCYAYEPPNLLAALADPLGQTLYYERDELGREIAKLLPNGGIA